MSCIVAIKYYNTIYMGADSAGVSGTDIRIRKDGKICQLPNDLGFIGFTSSFRMGQIIRYNFNPIKKMDEDIYTYVHTTFIQQLRECLKEHGYVKITDNTEQGGEMLLAIENKLFHIFSDFSIGQMVKNYDACGCGENYALGSLYETEKTMSKDPVSRIQSALAAAGTFSNAVKTPFEIVSLTYE